MTLDKHKIFKFIKTYLFQLKSEVHFTFLQRKEKVGLENKNLTYLA